MNAFTWPILLKSKLFVKISSNSVKIPPLEFYRSILHWFKFTWRSFKQYIFFLRYSSMFLVNWFFISPHIPITIPWISLKSVMIYFFILLHFSSISADNLVSFNNKSSIFLSNAEPVNESTFVHKNLSNYWKCVLCY